MRRVPAVENSTHEWLHFRRDEYGGTVARIWPSSILAERHAMPYSRSLHFHLLSVQVHRLDDGEAGAHHDCGDLAGRPRDFRGEHFPSNLRLLIRVHCHSVFPHAGFADRYLRHSSSTMQANLQSIRRFGEKRSLPAQTHKSHQFSHGGLPAVLAAHNGYSGYPFRESNRILSVFYFAEFASQSDHLLLADQGCQERVTQNAPFATSRGHGTSASCKVSRV